MSSDNKYAMKVLFSTFIVFSVAFFIFYTLKLGHSKSKNPKKNEYSVIDNREQYEQEIQDLACVEEEVRNQILLNYGMSGDELSDRFGTDKPIEYDPDENTGEEGNKESVTEKTASSNETLAENKTEKETKTKEELLNELYKDDPVDDGTSLPSLATIKFKDSYDMYRYERDYTKADDNYFDRSVFIGDSRTEGLSLFGDQANMNVFAYKGLTVADLETEKVVNIDGTMMTVYEAVVSTDYDNYYIQFGINEIGWAYVDVFTDDVSRLVDLIYAHKPNAMVYISSVAPVTKSVSDADKQVFNINNIKKFNDALFNMCHDRGDVIYLDEGASVATVDGYLPEGHTTDGKHYDADLAKRMLRYIRTHKYKRKAD